MKLNEKILKFSRWDSYSAVIFILAVMFQAIKWRLLPIFIDIYYHLLTAAGFNEAGGWVPHCFWEYAPVGRPQLYPPLLHIIMLLLIKLGIPIMMVGRLMQGIIYPLVLFSVWYVVRALFDKRQAFFTLIMLFSIYAFYLTTVIALAASLSFILCFFSLFFFEKNKIIPSSLLLALGLYTHGYTSWIFVGYFLLYAALSKKSRTRCLAVAGAALGLASPLLIFQFTHSGFFHLQRNILENYSVELSIAPWVLFLFAFAHCLRERQRYLIVIVFFCSSALLLASGIFSRYMSFYGALSAVLVNAAFLNHWYERLSVRQLKVLGGVFFALFVILSPTLTLQRPFSWHEDSFQGIARLCLNGECSVAVDCLNSSYANFIVYGRRNKVRAIDITIYNEKHFRQLTDVIRNYSGTDDILYSNMEYLAGLLALLSHRATSTAMLLEVTPHHPFDAVAVSRLIIWQKDYRDMKQEPVALIQKYGLRKIADTALAFVYENPSCTAKRKIIPATIGYKTLFFMLFLVGMAIAVSAKLRLLKKSFQQSHPERSE